MTEPTETASPWYRSMRARRPDEHHRVSTPLELLFDLCFVVAVAQAAAALHHAHRRGPRGTAFVGYLMVFFAIWWAWMNFTWFASAYDTDDVPYRLTMLVQIAGSLVLAAGMPRAVRRRRLRRHRHRLRDHAAGDGRPVAARGRARTRRTGATALRVRDRHHASCSSAGCCACSLPTSLVCCRRSSCWSSPSSRCRSRPNAAGQTTWHPHHIAERYGLFTLIVLGESVLPATIAFQAALDDTDDTSALIGLGDRRHRDRCSAMWWIYFDHEAAPDG